MKLSVSVSADDVAVLDQYVREAGLSSRSAGVQRAIAYLRHPHLDDDYAAAWDDWESSPEAAAWETTTGDGLTSATR
jgi:hypothetical protein